MLLKSIKVSELATTVVQDPILMAEPAVDTAVAKSRIAENIMRHPDASVGGVQIAGGRVPMIGSVDFLDQTNPATIE